MILNTKKTEKSRVCTLCDITQLISCKSSFYVFLFIFFLHVHYSSFMQQYSPTWPANHSTAGCIWQKKAKKQQNKTACWWRRWVGVGGQPNYYINTWNTRDDVSLCPGVLGWRVGGASPRPPLHELLSLFIHLTFSRGWWRR